MKHRFLSVHLLLFVSGCVGMKSDASIVGEWICEDLKYQEDGTKDTLTIWRDTYKTDGSAVSTVEMIFFDNRAVVTMLGSRDLSWRQGPQNIEISVSGLKLNSVLVNGQKAEGFDPSLGNSHMKEDFIDRGPSVLNIVRLTDTTLMVTGPSQEFDIPCKRVKH